MVDSEDLTSLVGCVLGDSDVAATVAEFICRKKLRTIWLDEVKTQLAKLEDSVLASNVLARYRLVSSIAGGEGVHVCATCTAATKRCHMVAYAIELAYDLMISKSANISNSPGSKPPWASLARRARALSK